MKPSACKQDEIRIRYVKISFCRHNFVAEVNKKYIYCVVMNWLWAHLSIVLVFIPNFTTWDINTIIKLSWAHITRQWINGTSGLGYWRSYAQLDFNELYGLWLADQVDVTAQSISESIRSTRYVPTVYITMGRERSVCNIFQWVRNM